MFRYPRVVNRDLRIVPFLRLTDKMFVTRRDDIEVTWIGQPENPDSFLLYQSPKELLKQWTSTKPSN
jgi:hypothetical protein